MFYWLCCRGQTVQQVNIMGSVGLVPALSPIDLYLFWVWLEILVIVPWPNVWLFCYLYLVLFIFSVIYPDTPSLHCVMVCRSEQRTFIYFAFLGGWVSTSVCTHMHHVMCLLCLSLRALTNVWSQKVAKNIWIRDTQFDTMFSHKKIKNLYSTPSKQGNFYDVLGANSSHILAQNSVSLNLMFSDMFFTKTSVNACSVCIYMHTSPFNLIYQGRDMPKPSTMQIYYIFIYYIFSYCCNFI
jgi:hypothetical protein